MDEYRVWKRSRRKRRLRLLAVTLVFCLLFTTYPNILETLSVFAAGTQDGGGTVYVTGFAGLPEEVREQTVPLGTGIEELTLPDTLEVFVTITEEEDAAEEDAPDKKENPDDSGSKEDNTVSGAGTDTETGTDETGDETENGDGTAADGDTETGDSTENNGGDTDNSGDSTDNNGDIGTEDNNGDDTDNNGGSTDSNGGDQNTGGTDDIEENSDAETENEQDTQSEESNGSEETNETAVTDSEDIADTKDEENSTGESAPAEEQGENVNGQENAPAEEQQESVPAQETHTFTMQEYHAENAISVQTLESTQTEKQEETVTISGIIWQSEPEYDGNTEGTYIFTAVLPDGYTLAEGVSLPQITVTVGNGIDAIIQALRNRIAALPYAEESLASEPDMEDEDAYAEWEEKLYEYAEEALAILEEYEALTEEQQAQISEEELIKLTAWVEIAETLAESSQVMTTNDAEHKHCICSGSEAIGDHTNHTEIEYKMLTTNSSGQILCDGNVYDNNTLTTGNYYLPEPDNPEDKTEIEIGTITIDGNVTLCLNGGTLRHIGETGSVIVVKSGTFTLCDCKNDTGCITGGKGILYDTTSYGGGVLVNSGATFNMYGGVITKNTAHNGGGVDVTHGTKFQDESCVFNMYGGKIVDNTAIAGGGGINLINAHANIVNGTIEGNTAWQGGGIYVNRVYLTMSNVSVVNNIVTNSHKDTGIAGAGIYFWGNTKFYIAGKINIAQNLNQYDNRIENVYLRNNMFFHVTDKLDGSSIGITAQTPPSSTKPTPVQVAGGKEYGITPADWSCFFSDKDGYEILWKETTDTGNELWLALPGSCDLGGLDLSASGATLSPSFDPDTTRYTSTVANSVDKVGITATLADTASRANITIKINDGSETPMDSGVTKTVDLVEGENTIVITVTADGMSKTYIIEITREAPAGFTVTLNGNGGSAGTALTTYTYGAGATLPTDWTRAGYKFAGWYENKDCTGTKVENISTTDTGDKKYWASWTPTSYSISYDLDGGAVTGNPTSYTIENSAITLINPTKTGYSFGGWSGTDLTGSNNMSVTIAAGSTGNREYKAHWTAADYTVTLNGNGGQGGTSLISYAHGTGATLPTDWTRAGYNFAGWYDNENCTGTAVTEISATEIGDKEYWAKWTPQTYQVTFDYHGANGEDLTANQNVTYAGKYGALPVPLRDGYTFHGWYTEADGKGAKIDAETTVTTASAHTLHAYWKDETAPNKPTLQDSVALITNWTNTQTTIPLKTYDGVGVTELWVSIDGKYYIKIDGFSGGTGSVNYEYTVQSGEHTYQFIAKDAAGNTSVASDKFEVRLDQEVPVIGTLTYDNAVHLNLWHWIIGKKSMVVHVPVTDTGSGVTEIHYTLTPRDAAGNLDGSKAEEKTATVTDGEAKITFAADFRGTIAISCSDAAGNAADGVTVGKDAGGVIVEDQAPTITVLADRNLSDTQQTQQDGVAVSEGYYDSVPALFVTVKDDTGNAITAGIATVTYQVEGGEEKSVTVDGSALQTQVSFTIPASEIPTGITKITIKTTDNAGNPAGMDITVKVKGPEKQPAAVIDYRQEELAGLVPGGEYLIDGEAYTADQEGCIPIEEDWLNDSLSIIKKGNNSETGDSPAQNLSVPARPAAPNAPELSARTENSITLKTIIGAQYRLGDGTGNWQDSAVFEGLNPKTPYFFSAYYPATDTSFASKESGKTEIATMPTPPTPDQLGINYEAETLAPASGIEAFSDASCTTPVTAGSAEDYMGTTVYIRYQADGIIPASAVTPVSVPERTPAPTPGTTDASYPEAEDGKLTGLTAGGSYMLSSDGGSTWQSRTANESGEITGLKAGTYELYVAAGSMNFRSETATVTVGAKPATKYDTPDIRIDYDNRTLTGFDTDGTYLINGEEVSVRQDGTIEIDAGWFGTTLSIIRRGNGKDKTDSDAQSLFVPTLSPKPTPTGVDVSTAGGTGKLTGLTAGTTYEISTDGGRTWETQPKTADGSGEITGLEPGTYTVRVKAGASNFASEPSEPATIGAYKVTVTFMVDGTVYKEIPVDYGTDLTDIPSVPGKDGKAGEWCVDAQGSSLAKFTNITADMTVYAVYTTAYTVTLQGGEGYVLSAENGSTSPVKAGGSFTFRFDLKAGYHCVNGSFAVMVDNAKVELINDAYTITDIRRDLIVKVVGVEKDADKPSGGGGNNGNDDDDSEPTPTPTPEPSQPPTDTPPTTPTPQPTTTPGTTPPVTENESDGRKPGTTPVPEETHEPDEPESNETQQPSEPSQTQTPDTTSGSLTYSVGKGAVIVTLNNVDETVCAARVADASAVAQAVLSEEELAEVKQGQIIEIRIDVERLDVVPQEDAEVIEKGIEDCQEQISGLVMGMYVDISMYMRIGSEDWNAIHATNKPVEIILDVPDELAELTADFYIMRSHEGEYLLMEDLDKTRETITIQTEAFSTYAILYQMQEGIGGKPAKCSLCHICPTFLGICCFIWLAVIVAAVLLIWILIRSRRKKEEKEQKTVK